MTPFGLEQHIIDRLVAVLRVHPLVERAVIYGSRAVGTYKAYSDIDLGIYAPAISDEEFARLRFEIDELPIVFKTDVVHCDQLGDQTLRNKIDHEGKGIYPQASG